MTKTRKQEGKLHSYSSTDAESLQNDQNNENQKPLCKSTHAKTYNLREKSAATRLRSTSLKEADLNKQKQQRGSCNEKKTKNESGKMQRQSLPAKQKVTNPQNETYEKKFMEALNKMDQEQLESGKENDIATKRQVKAKFKIVAANKGQSTSNAKKNLQPQNDAIAPIQITLNWNPATVPPDVQAKKRGPKKKSKSFKTMQTQTQNGEIITERPLNADKLVKSALNEFFQNLSNKFVEDSKNVPQNMPYVYWPSQHGALSAPLNPQQHTFQKSRMQINNKARVPTGSQQLQCIKVSSTASPENAKPLVPAGAVEAQPLWRREDVWKLGNFKDLYDFPKKKRCVIDPALLDEEDRRVLELNELEKQKAEIERLRRETELFGEASVSDAENDSDDDGEGADACFSDDDNENPTETMQNAEQSAMIEERILNTIDDPIICELLKQVEVPPKETATKDKEEEHLKPKLIKTKRTFKDSQTEDDAISLCASSFDSLTSDSEERMKDFEEEPAKKRKKEMSPVTESSKKQEDEKSPVLEIELEFEQKIVDPITAPIDPSFPYLKGIRHYFCPKFLKFGKCGYPCSFDLLCPKRLQQIPMDPMKDELKNLDPSELIAIFKFISESFPCFNAFFPPLSSALGANKLVNELICAVNVCEKPNFHISYYKWVVDGLIRAKLPPQQAIDVLIEKKISNTPAAKKILLDIILKNNLLTEHIDVLFECTETPSLHFEAHTVERIICHLHKEKMRNGSDIALKVLKKMNEVEMSRLRSFPHIEAWIDELSQDDVEAIESQPVEDKDSYPENEF